MKLSWRMTLVMVTIVIVAVCLSGTVMLLASFRSEMNSAIQAAAEELDVLCRSLGTLAGQSHGAPETAMVKLLEDSALFRDSGLDLFSCEGESLWSPQGRKDSLTTLPDEQGLYFRFQPESPENLELIRRLTIGTDVFYVRMLRQTPEPFRHARQNLITYTWALLLSVAVSLIAAVVCTGILLRPIRLLSRSTRAIAQGQYGRRVRVFSRDELGALAADFNTMAKALEQRIRELTEAAQRQREFTAAFAHELKTPLTSVIGYADMLRSKVLPPPRMLEAADYIYTEGQRLETMSRTLLELFRLEECEPKLTRVGTGLLAEELEKILVPLLSRRQIRLRLQVEPGEVDGVPELLVSLLYNLVDNAAKASQPGSAVILLGRQDAEGYCFAVMDRGCGIPAEALKRITEAFYMVDRSRSRAQGGAGLGLALCSRIARLHGAELEFESRVGYGTRVRLTLGKKGENVS